MSDPKSSYGEPVDEPKPVGDDVVGSVNEGLADAEAAGRDAVSEPPADETPAHDVPAHDATAHDATAEETPVHDAPAADVPVRDDAPAPDAVPASSTAAAGPASSDDEITDASAYMAAYREAAGEDATPAPHESTVASHAYEAPAGAAASAVVAPSEPVATAAPAGPQPIFVQAPEAPRARGNRAAAGAIGLIAALSFAVLYLGAWLGVNLLQGDLALEGVVEAITTAVMSWVFWVPVVLFFVGFWLLGAIINRGRWAHWVIFGFFVGVFAWFGYIMGLLFQEPFWMLSPTEGVELLRENIFSPLAVCAFVIGRELTIWFGAWASARGKRVTEINTEAMREYERTLEAGPQLYRA